MNALVSEAARRGLNVHIRAVGDLAVKASFDAFAAARNAMPRGTYPSRSLTRVSWTHRTFLDSDSCT
jgi:predicted amidohydrolase YtcJ